MPECRPSRLAGNDAGVYIGASATDYSDLRLGDPAGADSYFMTGNALSILANRISYVFDLRGPSLAVDTACSSSLVALHQACEAIRAGRIASAIVGGVNLLLTPYPFLGFCRASMLSPRGRCFAFDDRADGYVRGEGGGVVIVKPLADALAADDPIRAVILATGTNSDGRTIGLSLPSEAAQASLLRSVYARGGDRSGRARVFRDARHRDAGRRSDRSRGGRTGDRTEAARAAADRLGQDQYRSSGTGIGHGRPAEGGAGARPRGRAADPALRQPKPRTSPSTRSTCVCCARPSSFLPRAGSAVPGSTRSASAAPTRMWFSPRRRPGRRSRVRRSRPRRC